MMSSVKRTVAPVGVSVGREADPVEMVGPVSVAPLEILAARAVVPTMVALASLLAVSTIPRPMTLPRPIKQPSKKQSRVRPRLRLRNNVRQEILVVPAGTSVVRAAVLVTMVTLLEAVPVEAVPAVGSVARLGGGPGGGGLEYSASNYMIAFLGKPSTTTPWLLQIGGHHLAFNISYKGTVGASTPYFVGVEPSSWKDDDGKTHAPLAPMRDAMYGLVNSLTPDQLTKAKLNRSFSDVYVGPGRDGRFPVSEGVPVAGLSDESKKFVKQAIDAWTGDSPQGADYRKLYYADLDKTKVAYSGTTTFAHQGDYVRIDGPRVWIEFACQDGVVIRGQIHYHTIWRDRLTDYNAEFRN